MKNIRKTTIGLLLAGSLLSPGAVYTWTGAVDSDWETGGNWSTDSASWAQPNQQNNNEYVNDDAALIELLIGGEVTRNGSLSIQQNGGGTVHEMRLGGGTVLNVGTIWIADDGGTQGLVTVNDGTINLSGRLEVGDDNGCVGTLDLTDATISMAGRLYVADNSGSTGTLTATNSTINVGDRVDIAQDAPAQGSVSLDRSTLAITNRLYMNDSGGAGHVSSLTLTNYSYVYTGDNSYLNDDSTGTATVSLTDSSFYSGGTFDIPWNGDGSTEVTLDGGTIQVATALRLGAGGGTGGLSRLNITSGLVQAESLAINVIDGKIVFVDGELRINEADKTVADIEQLITDGKIDVSGAPNYEVVDSGSYTILRNSTGSTALFFTDLESLRQGGGTVPTLNLPGSPAAGQPNVTYQWFKDGGAVAGATSSSYAKAGATFADSGSYHLEASAGGKTIKGPMIQVDLPRIIFTSADLSDVAVFEGENTSFTATASAPTSTVSYQWFKDDVAIPGANSDTLSFMPAAAADAGSYYVEATNGFGDSIQTNAATLTIKDPIVIIDSNLGDLAVYDGDFICFKVEAEARVSVSYQWFFNGSILAGEDSNELIIDAAAAGNAGAYSVVITNQDSATLTTNAVTLSVNTGQYFSENFDRFVDALGPWVSASEGGGDGTDWIDLTGAQAAGSLTGWTMTLNSGHGPTSSENTNVVTEFNGWTFIDPVTWNNTAGQNRSSFTKGRKVVAVADSDEFDDLDDAAFNATLSTPDIDISTLPAGNILTLSFDSSWRAEPQTGTLTIQYDGGTPVEILRYDGSTPSRYDETINLILPDPAGATNLKINWTKEGSNNWWWAIDNIVVRDDALFFTEEPQASSTFVGFPFSLSAEAVGQTGVTYEWFKDGVSTAATGATYSVAMADLSDAGTYRVEASATGTVISSSEATVNVSTLPDPAQVVYAENFDTAVLGTSVQEDFGRIGVWTQSGPSGWVVDRSQVVGVGNDELGIEEWEGWTFADQDWWATVAGDQGRVGFTRSGCAVAIADPDEWDDNTFVDPNDPLNRYSAAGAPNAMNAALGEKGKNYNTTLTSPVINLPTLSGADALTLRMHSSWRPEDWQEAKAEIRFDGGNWTTLFHWNSREGDTDPGGNAPDPTTGEPDPTNPEGIYHPDNTNEVVKLPLTHSASAATMELRFTMPFGGNDWWWAIDNIIVYDGTTEPVDVLESPNSVFILAGSGDDATFSVTPDPESNGPFSYQWFQGAGAGKVALTDETSDTLTISAPGVAEEGSYSVEISNPVSSFTTCANLNIVPFNFVGDAKDFTGANSLVAGDDGFIDFFVQGYDENVEVTFYKVGDPTDTPVPGASNAGGTTPSIMTITQTGPSPDGLYTHDIELELTELSAAEEGQYYAVISNGFGTRTTVNVGVQVLEIVIDPNLTRQVVMEGDTITLTATADTLNLDVTNTFWYKAPFDDATDRSLVDLNDPRITATEALTTGYERTLTITGATPEDAAYYTVDFVTEDLGDSTVGVTTSGIGRVDVYATKLNTAIWSEDFESLNDPATLEDYSLENATTADSWTANAPAGWTVDNSAMQLGGHEEYFGWTFHVFDSWFSADDQQRSQFAADGRGVVAVADPDEYDDLGGFNLAGDGFNSYLVSPIIDITEYNDQNLVLCFDSSWRDEDLQTAVVEVSFDQGTNWKQLLAFSSVGDDPDFKDDAPAEVVSLAIGNTSSDTDVMFRWGCLTAGNDWWFAIDNVQLLTDVPEILITSRSYNPDTTEFSVTWTSDEGASYMIEYSLNGRDWFPGKVDLTGTAGTTTASIQVNTLGIGIPPTLLVRVVE